MSDSSQAKHAEHPAREALGRLAYEAAAKISGCDQPWDQANKEKWCAAAAAVACRVAALPTDPRHSADALAYGLTATMARHAPFFGIDHGAPGGDMSVEINIARNRQPGDIHEAKAAEGGAVIAWQAVYPDGTLFGLPVNHAPPYFVEWNAAEGHPVRPLVFGDAGTSSAIVTLIADDAYAASFQSLGQYRTALIAEARRAAEVPHG